MLEVKEGISSGMCIFREADRPPPRAFLSLAKRLKDG
jgi:hypothetical protein